MILAIDVQYKQDGTALAAGVLFQDLWHMNPYDLIQVPIPQVEPYEPGQFYKRELPCILAVIEEVNKRHDALDLNFIIVDGYVSLGSENKDGLGMHLYNALDKQIPVIGVAKKPYFETNIYSMIYRGSSNNPLYVTSVGIDPATARALITNMHGNHRIPTMLKRVDQLARGR